MTRRDGRLRVLLWAPLGAGDHYWGPGIAAYRLVRDSGAEPLDFDLVHAFPPQGDYPVYRRQFRLGALDRPQRVDGRFLVAAGRWLRSHAPEYDVIYGLSGFWYTFLPLALFGGGVPTVMVLTATCGGAFLPGPGRGSWRCRLPGIAMLKRRVAALVVLNDEMRQRAVAHGVPPDRVLFIPNGVDTKAFHPVGESERRARRAALGWPDRLTFVLVGGLMERKGQHLAIDALAHVQEMGTACQLALVGPPRDAAYHDTLLARARARTAPGSVIFVDHRPDVAVLYQASDVALLPSAMEGMPLSLLEAMATGLPAIVTDIAGTRDVARDGVDALFVPRQAEALGEAMRTLARDPRSRARFGAEGRARVEAGFSSAAVVRQHMDLFRALARAPHLSVVVASRG